MNISRPDIYTYIYTALNGNVDCPIYAMAIPQTLSTNDTTKGFIVMRLAEMDDQSEFPEEAYAIERAYIECYVPAKSGGKIDLSLYTSLQNSIDAVIDNMCNTENPDYATMKDNILNYEDMYSTTKNVYFMYGKSFKIIIKNN